MYYVTVIAFSHQVSVAMCFIHIIIIIITEDSRETVFLFRRLSNVHCPSTGKCGLLLRHVHCHQLITHCSHFLLHFQLPTGFVLVGLKIIIIIIRPHHRRMDRFYPRDAMIARVLAMALCPCLCVSVCLSQVGVLWKWMDRSSWFLAWEISLTYTVL